MHHFLFLLYFSECKTPETAVQLCRWLADYYGAFIGSSGTWEDILSDLKNANERLFKSE